MVNDLLNQLSPITLEEMKEIRLMNRIDMKFVTTLPVLRRLLLMAAPEYRVQETLDERNLEYNTTYFDTDTYDMYRVHQTGRTGRQKLRFRTYVSSNLQFMEVKTKNNHGRTKKKRMEVDDMSLFLPERVDFLQGCLRYDVSTLRPSLQNSFRRITLVNQAKTERLTIDTQLCFRNLQTGTQTDTGELVIVELKRDGLVPSPVLSMLTQLHVRPHGFSKYCMGLAMTDPLLRQNRIKPKLADIRKILERS